MILEMVKVETGKKDTEVNHKYILWESDSSKISDNKQRKK